MDNDKSKMPPLDKTALTAWRQRMGYSQRDACAAVGCSRGAWRGWEDGVNKVPRYIGLAMGALALGMNPYGEENYDPANPTTPKN